MAMERFKFLGFLKPPIRSSARDWLGYLPLGDLITHPFQWEDHPPGIIGLLIGFRKWASKGFSSYGGSHPS